MWFSDFMSLSSLSGFFLGEDNEEPHLLPFSYYNFISTKRCWVYLLDGRFHGLVFNVKSHVPSKGKHQVFF
jgi:hypothetical protein